MEAELLHVGISNLAETLKYYLSQERRWGRQCFILLETTCKVMSLIDVPRRLRQRSPLDVVLQGANVNNNNKKRYPWDSVCV